MVVIVVITVVMIIDGMTFNRPDIAYTSRLPSLGFTTHDPPSMTCLLLIQIHKDIRILTHVHFSFGNGLCLLG